MVQVFHLRHTMTGLMVSSGHRDYGTGIPLKTHNDWSDGK